MRMMHGLKSLGPVTACPTMRRGAPAFPLTERWGKRCGDLFAISGSLSAVALKLDARLDRGGNRRARTGKKAVNVCRRQDANFS